MGKRGPLHVDPEQERGAGRADDEDVHPGGDADPEVELKESTPQHDRLRPVNEPLHARRVYPWDVRQAL